MSSDMLAGVRILVVDDEQDLIDMWQIALSIYGAEVKTASNSQYGELIQAEDDGGPPDVDKGPPWI